MRRAGEGDRVRIHYTGQLADGTVFDTTRDRDAHELVIGDGTTLQDFEQAIVGLAPGESIRVEIPSRRAYGHRQRTLLRVLRPELLPTGVKIKVGQRLRVDQGDGTFAVVTVTGKSGGEVMVDMNHPLAGQDLAFDIELVEIVGSAGENASGPPPA
ncbi:MAG: FKBP-type peptidyl-prolyl cis-trans isomerase [Candidatus Krumholzibacteriia bacterium]